jgi:hypothetical protein
MGENEKLFPKFLFNSLTEEQLASVFGKQLVAISSWTQGQLSADECEKFLGGKIQ